MSETDPQDSNYKQRCKDEDEIDTKKKTKQKHKK